MPGPRNRRPANGQPIDWRRSDQRAAKTRPSDQRIETSGLCRQFGLPALTAEELAALLSAIFACSPDGMAFLDPNLAIRAANGSFSGQIGVPLEKIVDRPADQVMPGWWQQLGQMYQTVRATGHPFTAESHTYEFKDQPERGVTYWDFSVFPVHSGGGVFLGYLLLQREVTQRKRVKEEALKKAQEELESRIEERTKELARANERLLELDKLKDDFIAMAAHELKTPVTIMKGFAQALLRSTEDMPPPRRKMLDSIDLGADRIGRIVNDMLDVSQLQLGQLNMSEERVNLLELVEEVVDRMALTATKHHIQVVKAEPAVVRGDRDRLEQVLVNLIDNAIKYSPSGGAIEVSVSLLDHDAVVCVKDYGVGIAAVKQGHIFERFYSAHTGTPYDYGGMGVRLYISKAVITQHGGKMWFESEEGRGSSFCFSLPLQQERVRA